MRCRLMFTDLAGSQNSVDDVTCHWFLCSLVLFFLKEDDDMDGPILWTFWKCPRKACIASLVVK